jgi:hypothetical protein
MKNSLTLALFFAAAIFLAAACNTDKAQEDTTQPVVLESLTIQKKSGPDCDKPDSLRLNCVEINFRYPSVKDAGSPLKPIVEAWSKDFLTSLIAYAEEPDNMPPLDEAIQNFINMHDEMVAEIPDGPAYYMAEAWDTVLLNDGKRLTLKIDGYNYAGGAHGNSAAAVATWDVATGQQVHLGDLVTDMEALKARAEKKFREVKAEVFKPESEGGWGFNFDETFPFKIADNTGLTGNGIYFCYVPYEVGPYAMGSTEFVLSFDEIKDLMK